MDDGNGDVGGGSGGPGRPPTVHEGTPLMQSSIPRQYVYADEEEDEERLRREIDLVFGKWPGRLLNSNVRILLLLSNHFADIPTVVVVATRAFRVLPLYL